MKTTSLLAALAAGLALALPAHAATYSFSGFFGETLPPGQSDYTATFSFSIAAPIASDTTIAASAMTSCTTHASACESATFYVDAAAAGLAPDHHDWQAVELASRYSSSYYYFEAPTFTADGTHADVFGVGPATLTVDASAVAEPATIALLGAGLPLLLAASRRKRGGATL